MLRSLHSLLCLKSLLIGYVLLDLSASTMAQQLTFDLPKSKYGLPVVNDVAIYKKL